MTAMAAPQRPAFPGTLRDRGRSAEADLVPIWVVVDGLADAVGVGLLPRRLDAALRYAATRSPRSSTKIVTTEWPASPGCTLM
jgi:hypothetical protein